MTDTDIVVRLRLEGSDVCVEAAQEIEHLREALGFAQAALATIKGTLEQGQPDAPPFHIEDAAPNTPR